MMRQNVVKSCGLISDALALMDVSNDDNDHEISVTESFKLITDEPVFIKRWHAIFFFHIIDHELKDFFEFDHCNILADNYLIAMVFTYFVRASLTPSEYTSFNFFIALCLANIMEEDDEQNYENILLWAISKAKGPNEMSVFKCCNNFFKRLNYRCIVSRSCCDLMMQVAQPSHKVWQRKRHVNHSGVISEYYRINNTCPSCCSITEEKVEKKKVKTSTKSTNTSELRIKRFKLSHHLYKVIFYKTELKF